MGAPRLASACFVLAALAFVGACASSEEQERIDRESIAAALELYLPRLGDAYSTGDLAPLEGLAAQKEIAAIEKRISDLAGTGRTLEAVFREVTVEDVTVFNYANAYVTTVEVWDLRTLSTGTDRELASEIGQHSRVKYQLKREGDSWLVLFRTIQG